jgi:alpha-glucosidase
MSNWWQEGVIYQIYPRSFQDSNADGVGDLPGITSRLDYLRWLGIDGIWISPIYPSPMADFGYDVSDYRTVHPLFGTLSDMDELVAAAHNRGLKLILDFVPNHTSNQHPWFLDSRASRMSPRRDWYIWHDPVADGGPPNNWLSRFDGESAWSYDATTGQYYLHSFLAEQPDLNWRNPEVRKAMLDVLRFWFERGIDGFRVDVSYRVMKDLQLRDNPPNPAWRAGMDPHKRLLEKYTKNLPEIHDFNRWLREVADRYEGRVLIGEINLPHAELVTHYGNNDEFHLPFNFSLIYAPWEAAAIKEQIANYERHLPPHAWPNYVLGNHDQPRVATRAGQAQAGVAMMLLLTLRGTPTVYYGDEIGMHNVPVTADRAQDPWEKNLPGQGFGRDPERTPMQWDGSANAGFCPEDVEPWLPIASDFRERNVARQRGEPRSLLTLTRHLLALRRTVPAMTKGSIDLLPAPESVLAYRRQAEPDDGAYFIALNFAGEPVQWQIPAAARGATVQLSTEGQRDPLIGGILSLAPNEGVILALAHR